LLSSILRHTTRQSTDLAFKQSTAKMSISEPSNGAKLMLWTAGTPNGYKPSIFLEELKAVYGIDYDFRGLKFSENEQKQEWFLKINPNGRIPALTDYNVSPPHNVFESAAILLWLAERYDTKHEFSFEDPIKRSETLQWMFFAHGGVGPMQGQANHFFRYAPEKIPYGIKRYIDETKRLYSVLEDRLSGRWEGGNKRDYLVGDGKGKYTIADINVFPWVRMWSWSGVDSLDQFPNLAAWIDRLAAREGVKKGLEVPQPTQTNLSKEEQEKKAEEAKQWIHQK